MRPICLYLSLLASFFLQSCKEKSNIFLKTNDLTELRLKGRVKSMLKYISENPDGPFSIEQKEFDSRGFLTEAMDSSGTSVTHYLYVYDKDGLLTKKQAFSMHGQDTVSKFDYIFTYSFTDRTRTISEHSFINGIASIDTEQIKLDEKGNEIKFRWKSSIDTFGKYAYFIFFKYDNAGFLIENKLCNIVDTTETMFVNDKYGRVLEETRPGFKKTYHYDSQGNEIQRVTTSEHAENFFLTGYCGFDRYGNYLKRISVNPVSKQMSIEEQKIEYY